MPDNIFCFTPLKEINHEKASCVHTSGELIDAGFLQILLSCSTLIESSTTCMYVHVTYIINYASDKVHIHSRYQLISFLWWELRQTLRSCSVARLYQLLLSCIMPNDSTCFYVCIVNILKYIVHIYDGLYKTKLPPSKRLIGIHENWVFKSLDLLARGDYSSPCNKKIWLIIAKVLCRECKPSNSMIHWCCNSYHHISMTAVSV